MQFLIFFFLVNSIFGKFINTSSAGAKSFYSRIELKNGVRQINIRFGNVKAIETIAGPSEGAESGLVVRQISNGRQIVSLIYSGIPSYFKTDDDVTLKKNNSEIWKKIRREFGQDELGINLRECKIEKSRRRVQNFVEHFDELFQNYSRPTDEILSNSKRVFIKLKNKDDINQHNDIHELLNFAYFKQKCYDFHRTVRDVLKSKKKVENKVKKSSKRVIRSTLNHLFIMPGTKWCGSGNLAEEHGQLDAHLSADNCCRMHDLCPWNIPRLSNKYGLQNYGFITITHCACDTSIPQTKWCGRGNTAATFSELGGFYDADNCCRQHDTECPLFIRSFEMKYGYFNLSLGTLSHCSCDARFRTCLKQSNSGASEMVGNVFFNIIQLKCFDFKREKVCLKRDVWKCLKWGYEMRAFIRGPLPWKVQNGNEKH